MPVVRFWLLDINYEVTDHNPEIWMWGIVEENQRILMVDRRFSAYFYLMLDEGEKAETVLQHIMDRKDEFSHISKLEPEELKLFGKPVNVIKVYCQDPDLIPKCSKALYKIAGVKECIEDDIRFSMRYLVDNDLAPCAWHEVEAEETSSNPAIQADRIYEARSTPKRVRIEKLPPLRVLGFSVISYSQKGKPKPHKDPIVVLAAATNSGEKRLFLAEGYKDRELIRSYIEFVRSFDPDIIVGYGSNREDWQYLLERSRILDTKLYLDRTESEPNTSTYGHISVTGRADIDLLDFAEEFPEVKVKALENIADYLGVMKLERRILIEDIDFPEYWDNPEKRPLLIQFAEENAKCVMGIYDVVGDFAMQLSQLVWLPLDQIGRAATGFRVESYLIRNAHNSAELIPARLERPYIPYAGGEVLQPKPGIHENIAVLDFKSMYPNIMIEENISPDTYVPASESQPQSGLNIAPEVNHRFRKEPPGLYKTVLSNLIKARDETRTRLKDLDVNSVEYRVLDARQKAIKVITNACYGYAGWIGARWYIKPVAEATTAWGRSIIRNAIEAADEIGLDVIYGDTDSIFIGYDQQKIGKLTEIIEKKIGLEIRPDKIYRRILFTEAKKRYCGMLPEGQLEIVGLEVVRGDWAKVAKDVQERVLELILRERSANEAVKFVRGFISDLREKKVPYRDLIIWKTLTKPIEQYDVRTPHVEAAKLLRKEGWELTVGDKVGYVITMGSGRLYERVKPYALVSYQDVDAEYYVTNQVVPAASRILSLFNIKEADLLPLKPSRTLLDFPSRT